MNPFLAEIKIFPFNFPPSGWAACNGQLLPISQNTALFALVGVTYGGDGKSTFALPNLQGASALHPGQGSGLSYYEPGQMGGSPNVTLLESEIPFHTHTLYGKAAGTTSNPDNAVWATPGTQRPAPNFYANAAGSPAVMGGSALIPAGSSLPHNNMMPYLTLNFCIALQGVFPQRP